MAEIRFEGNSLKGRQNKEEQAPSLTPVIDKKAIQRKPKFSILNALYKDTSKPFSQWLLHDLVIPNTMRLTGTILHGVVSKLFGNGAGNFVNNAYHLANSWWGSSTPYYGSGNYQYPTQGTQSNNKPTSQQQASQASTDLTSYALQSREDAERVLEGLGAYIDTYDTVPVSAFFELIGVPAPYTYHDFGWTNLADAKVITVENGWSIKFPKPVRLR